MATFFEKLLLKDQDEILVLNAPESFEPELARLPVATVHRSLRTARVVRFSLAFVTRQIEIHARAPTLGPSDRRCSHLVFLSQGHFEEIRVRFQSGYGMECLERCWI